MPLKVKDPIIMTHCVEVLMKKMVGMFSDDVGMKT